jgi:hypothetical protein
VFDSLKGQLGLEHHGARTAHGVFTRVAQRLLALAAAVWRNWAINAPTSAASSPTTTDPAQLSRNRSSRPESTRQHYEARAGSLADPVRMASRSLSESPPQTPWGSGAANAWARQSATTGQLRQMAAAACSRRRCPGPRLPSGWKNSSGLAPRQAPCRCHRNFLVDDPGRPRRSAIGTSKRVVTTVTAPDGSGTIRRGVSVVGWPGLETLQPGRPCEPAQQHYDAAAPPVPSPPDTGGGVMPL